MLNFRIPNTFLPHWQSKCDINTKKIIDIPIIHLAEAKQRNCPLNVQRYIDQYGGVAKYGWTYTTLANVIIRFVGHVVVETIEGKLLCVTPSEFDISSIKFIPDDETRIQTNENGRLPVHTVPLYDKFYIVKYAYFENLISSIRSKYPARTVMSECPKGVVMSDEDSISYTMAINELSHITNHHLLPFIRTNTKRNDKCPCGSTLKYKKCCERRLACYY